MRAVTPLAMASKAAARTAAGIAARHVASDVHRFCPRSPRRAFAGGAPTTPTAAWARPPPLLPHAARGPRILRRGLAMIPGDHSPRPEGFSPDWFDPEAPDDPSSVFAYDEADLASEEAMWAMYERWCGFYSVRRGRGDMLRRFGCFKDRARRFHEFNKSGMPFTMGLNVLGDATPEELAEFRRPKLFLKDDDVQ